MSCEPIASILTNKHPEDRRRGGFTLLEILVAMVIFAIVVGLIFASFEGVFSNADHMTAAGGMIEMGNACMDRITRDLVALHVTTYPRYSPPDIDDKPDIYRVQGTLESMGGDSFAMLRFASLSHLAFNQQPREGIAEIVYYVQEDPTGQRVLKRSDKLYPYPDFEPDPSDPVLCEKVKSFKLVYYSAKGDEREEWDSESDDFDYSTPRAVGITLVIGDDDASYEFYTEIAFPMYRFKEVKR